MMKRFLLIVVVLCGCSAPIKMHTPQPKLAVVTVNMQVQPWTSMEEIQAIRPLVYVYYDSATNYELAYLTPTGKIPFSRTEIVAGGVNDFWPSVLDGFNYRGGKDLSFAAKDVVYAAPCWVKVRAYTPTTTTAWSDSILVE